MIDDGVQARLRDLRRRPNARAALRAEIETAVAQMVFGTARELWIPPVPLPPPRNAPPPRILQEPGEWDLLAGLDESGRAVLVRSVHSPGGEPPAAVLAHPSEEYVPGAPGQTVIHTDLLRHEGDRLEVIHFQTATGISSVTWIDHDADGRPIGFATATEDGVEATRCEWEGAHCVRANDITGEYDDAGLLRVRDGDAVVWDRALHGYEPDPLDREAAFAAWVDALADAVPRAVDGGAFAVRVDSRFEHDEEPVAIPVDRAYFEDAAARVGADDAFSSCWKPSIPLLGLLDEHGLRAWRSLRQRGTHWSPVLAERLQERLADAPWPVGVAGAGTPRLPDVAPSAVAPLERVPASREELASVLTARRLPARLAEDARWGLALLPGGTGTSRLGGRPELTGAWPTADGRALTHLATIALDEVPEIEGRDVLPRDGTLVFFADLTEEGELWDPTPASDPRVRIVFIPAGTPTHPVDPPDEPDRDPDMLPPLLAERRVRFEPALAPRQNPEGLSAAEQLGYDRLYYDELAERMPIHLVLGHPCAVQWDPRGPDELNLLHIGYDRVLGFEWLDGADLTFHAEPGVIRAGRWDDVTVTPQSG
ncbi:DUF1963 domain-containing protein [Solirubrobacter soli]|uniref:DUF1963 domain-containing protein n=1 Tax=Solirubrobacter soli TaxID=363832 RepID=UPI0004044550|nr:DUF1963 domain-containing protein [Solirubrobacter soli]